MNKQKIAVITENDGITTEVSKLINQYKYKIIYSLSSMENISQKTKEDLPDLFLIDLNFDNEMSSIEIAHQINSRYHIPIVYINDKGKDRIPSLIKTTNYYGIINLPANKCEFNFNVRIALNKHQSETKLMDNRKWISIILKNITDGIITTDRNGTINLINSKAEELISIKEENAVGKKINETLIVKEPKTGNLIQYPLDKVLKTPHKIEVASSVLLISQDGNESVINETAAPIKDKSGNINGTLIIIHDITQESKSQHALRESEKLHRITLNSISDALFITDNYGSFTYICPNAEVIFGHTEEEIQGFSNISSLLGNDVFDWKEFKKKKEITNIERKIKNKHGIHKTLLVNVKEVSIGEGTILYTCHDATELKQAQERISNLNRMYFLLSEVNETIVRIKDFHKLLEEVCRIISDKGSFMLAWVGIKDYKTSVVKPVVYSGADMSFLEGIRISSNESLPEGGGPTGKVIREGMHYISNNIDEDKRFDFWRDRIKDKGFHSSITIPLWVGKEVVGALNVYSSSRQFFNDEEIYLFDRLGEDISLALTTIEYERFMERERSIYGSESLNKEIAEDIKTNLLRQIEVIKPSEPVKTPPAIVKNESSIQNIITQNKKFKEQLSYLPEIATSDLTTLIYGESGTGKELVASAIKNLSRREDKPFLVVNCAALPDNLLESELFGYKKGAFTGAVSNKIGLFKSADEGTIFLDEIGDISMNMQVKILRTLQEKEIIPLGSVKKEKVDIRFICATNKDLKQMVSRGSFREDLYYRLNVVTVNIPPLRERLDDIPLLVNYFMRKYSRQMDKSISSISKQALDTLSSYHYPGNVRELENIIKHALLFCKSNEIQAENLPKYVLEPSQSTHIIEKTKSKKSSSQPKDTDLSPDEQMEKKTIIDKLNNHHWNIQQTANSMGIHRSTLWRKMKKYGIR